MRTKRTGFIRVEWSQMRPTGDGLKTLYFIVGVKKRGKWYFSERSTWDTAYDDVPTTAALKRRACKELRARIDRANAAVGARQATQMPSFRVVVSNKAMRAAEPGRIIPITTGACGRGIKGERRVRSQLPFRGSHMLAGHRQGVARVRKAVAWRVR